MVVASGDGVQFKHVAGSAACAPILGEERLDHGVHRIAPIAPSAIRIIDVVPRLFAPRTLLQFFGGHGPEPNEAVLAGPRSSGSRLAVSVDRVQQFADVRRFEADDRPPAGGVAVMTRSRMTSPCDLRKSEKAFP